jgi:dolichol-phosphate mannosyltransferase
MSSTKGPTTGGGSLVVLPTYNERQNLQPMIAAILKHVPDADVLVVDDNSPDGTGELADGLAANDPHVHVLHRAAKEGLGRAYQAGFAVALSQPEVRTVVQMDCDFSHDPRDIPRLIGLVENGADLAIGSRYVPGGATPGWGVQRRLISRAGSLFARTVLGLPYRDLTGGFKAWRREALERLRVSELHANGYGFQIETTWKAHGQRARIVEMPITFRDRFAGKSKMSRAIMREALLLVLRLRLAPPRRGRRLGLDSYPAAVRSDDAVAWAAHTGMPSIAIEPPTSRVRYSQATAGSPHSEQGRLLMSAPESGPRESGA